MYKLSICIPTFNRSQYLVNCLNSIILNTSDFKDDIQICVSDNCSTDETESIVLHAKNSLNIVYRKNEKNIGSARNFLNVVDMADGEYVWMIGDDDLLMPDALEKILDVIGKNNDVDFFYINSFHLKTEYVFDHPQPFDTKNLPKNMSKFSSWNGDGKINFLDLIDYNVSFDFLGGIFLSVFNRKKWLENAHFLDDLALHNDEIFSHFDNTFPHIKIFANAFYKSKAYFYSQPLSVSLSGAQEWAPMYPFVRSVRLIEALDVYRMNGLSYVRFWQCKNSTLRNFIPDMAYMFINRRTSGYEHINLFKLIIKNGFYPEFYLSFFRYCFRKLSKVISLFVEKNTSINLKKKKL
jgi:glycosyltransferase involved in cell wall biosynthesis